ncbi:MAG: ornithine carbamoyltransferase [Leptospirales bacterium]|nr:ornithine carbamoyltransferase [Leptospirales bacterium]
MKIPKVRTKDLIDGTELNLEETLAIFEFAAELKNNLRKGKMREYLARKSLAMIFEKNSTRTRVSFEIGMYQLGGQAIFLSGNDIQISRGETLSDTAKVLSRYAAGIMIRTDKHEKAVKLAEESDVPVINGLTDMYHPCQALADMFTIYERQKSFKGVKLTYLGDGNNVAHSLLIICSLLGADISIASPKGYQPDPGITATAQKLAASSGSELLVTADIAKAVKEANYLYTDVWTSMGQEKETAKRRKAFLSYKITNALLKKAAPDCMVMHCLPAHRGEEIDADVIDSDRSVIFDQAENRLHVQKAVMCALMKK